MDILLKGVPDSLAVRMAEIAADQGLSRHEMLLRLLTATYDEPPLVVGWFKADRRGELDTEDCPECGQPLTEVWAALLSNGQWVGPRCSLCAVSDP